MDFGDTRSILFTTYEPMEYIYNDEEDLAALVSYSNTTRTKLMTARKTMRFLEHCVWEAEAMVAMADARGLGPSRYTFFRLTQYKTILYALYRYQLVLTRDLYWAHNRLTDFGYGSPRSLHDWERSADDITEYSPNVHDYFLWRSDPWDDDTIDSASTDSSFSVGEEVLWRPAD